MIEYRDPARPLIASVGLGDSFTFICLPLLVSFLSLRSPSAFDVHLAIHHHLS